MADVATKQRALIQLVSGDSRISIVAVTTLVDLGLHDSSPGVRSAALTAISARATMARWAGTSGPQLGPGPGPRRELPVIPIEWKDDQQTLRAAFYDRCVQIVRKDRDRTVRFHALGALGNLDIVASRDQPLSDEFITLLVSLYRQDADPGIRAEVVKSLMLVTNGSESARAVLRDGLVDRQGVVRSAALAAIAPETTSGRPRLSFEDARLTLEASLKAEDAGIRLGAVRALNVFGAPSAPYIPVLERMRETDSDSQVRTSAQLAIEAIQRALTGRVP